MWAVTLVEEKIINYITIIILHLCSCQSQQSVESKEFYELSELLNFEDIYLLRIIINYQTLLTKLVWSRLLDISLVLFLLFYGPRRRLSP